MVIAKLVILHGYCKISYFPWILQNDLFCMVRAESFIYMVFAKSIFLHGFEKLIILHDFCNFFAWFLRNQLFLAQLYSH